MTAPIRQLFDDLSQTLMVFGSKSDARNTFPPGSARNGISVGAAGVGARGLWSAVVNSQKVGMSLHLVGAL
jgi:hypothetical protein